MLSLKLKLLAKISLHSIKNKEKRYIDQMIDNKISIPGVGKYKNLENGLKFLSRPSTAKVKSCGGRK